MECSVTVEVDDAVFDVVDDEWQENFYKMDSKDDILLMIASNLVTGSRLSMLDGWGDQPDENAVLLDESWDIISAEGV